MPTVRIYAPALVCLVWAVVWGAGLRTDAVVVLGLLLVTVGIVTNVHEMRKRHHL